MKTVRLCFAAAVLMSAASAAIAAPDARDLMIKVDDMTNHSYLSSTRLIKFSTCRYRVNNGAVACAEKPRNLTFESISKSYPVDGARDNNNKAFDVIIDPANDKGTALLSYGYADDKKGSDFWIFLPAIGKVKRVVSVSDGNESGAVFGSEVSSEDSDVKKVKDYTYKLLGEEVYRKRPAWKIEMTPTADRRTRSYYGKIIAWVDKERFIVLKEDLYDRSGRHYKQFSALDFKKFGNAWLVTKASMNNLTSKRITVWEQTGIALNVDIEDEFLTQRPLTDFAYRERHLERYRNYLKRTPESPQNRTEKP
jgi:hypothetical protein